MIVTVTANPAIDVTYRLDRLRRGSVNRVGEVVERPGGKGVNVARVLHQLGEPVMATGLSGGPGGATLVAALTTAGIPVDFVDVLPDVRRTVVAHESDGTTTSLWEPGRAPADPEGAADALIGTLKRLLSRARAIVVSGSLPVGVDAVLPSRISTAAAAAGVPALIDVDAEALRIAARSGGAVLTPNTDEVTALLGTAGPGTLDEDVQAARRLVEPAGPLPAVVMTRGADGIAAVLPSRTLRARPPEVVTGNPTGAGDAVSAALARHLAAAGSYEAVDWPTALADAVALSTAAVLRPVAGEVDTATYEAWRDEITVEEL